MTIQTPPTSARLAKLETIDFSRLLLKDHAELLKLLTLCKRDGFFYLNLQGFENGGIIDDKDNVVRMMEEFFDLPMEQKMKDDRASHLHGHVSMRALNVCISDIDRRLLDINHLELLQDSKKAQEITTKH
jgi:hypothetical protein